MRNIFLICLLAATLFSCSKEVKEPVTLAEKSTETNAQRLTWGQNVKLFKAWTSYAYIYHGAYSNKRFFYAEVANMAFDKKVAVYHQLQNGSWSEFPMSFQRHADNNTEIWAAELDLSTNFSNTGTPPQLGEQFAIKYTVNGQTYWDNNKGQNYRMSATEGMYLQPELNLSADTHKESSYFAKYPNTIAATLNIVADVRNLAYKKNVTLVYTTNNWSTVQYAPLQFRQYYGIGNGSSLVSPNRFGIERWSINLPVDNNVSQVKYAISYQVNGQTFWDNNFGRNYTLNKVTY